MIIKELNLRNFRCFENLNINFQTGKTESDAFNFSTQSSDSKVTVLVAKNGQGKTSILDAVSICLGTFAGKMPDSIGKGFTPADIPSAPGINMLNRVEKGRPEVIFSMVFCDTEHNALKRQLTDSGKKPTTTIKDVKPLTSYAEKVLKNCNEYNASTTLPIIAYYGDNRLWGDNVLTKPHLKAMLTRNRKFAYADSMNPKSGYKEFIKWYAELVLSVESLKIDLSKHSSLDGINIKNGNFNLINCTERVPFNQTTNHQYSYQEITVNKHRDLACCNAYLEAINGVIEKNLKESGWNHIGYDVIRKEIYATNNNDVAVPVKNLSAGTKAVLGIVADLAYRCCQLNPQCGNAAPESTPGIVLIDEIELHLHPAWQQRIILDLQRAFPQIQLIITTHSPQVISSVPKECIRVIADGQVIQPEIETEGARAEQVLNEVFGTDSRVDELPIVKDLNKYKKLIEEDKWDSQEALELKRRLYENLSSDPELSRMAIDVKVKEYKRGHGQK